MDLFFLASPWGQETVTLIEYSRARSAEHMALRQPMDDPVEVRARILSTEEAIGRRALCDLPILRGGEVMIGATLRARGSSPQG